MVSWLASAVDAGRPFSFGELRIVPCRGGFEILAPGIPAGTRKDIAMADLRGIIQFDDGGRYRPLGGARTMPTGWSITVPRHAVVDVLETIYPLSTRHIEQEDAGSLRVVSLDAVLARQTGRYERAGTLSPEGRAVAKTVLCGNCVRIPVWAGEAASRAIPCPEPCSVMVSLCREAAGWERTPPSKSANPAAGFADFETPGNEIREAWLRMRNPGADPGV